MTERDLQLAIMRDRYRRHVCLPNYTPRGWWECDVFELTKARSFREYEVKISRSDFAADARKFEGPLVWRIRTGGDWTGGADDLKTKLDRLSASDRLGPSQFWYVCPAGLIDPTEVHKFSGLIHVSDGKWVKEVKAAPQLHSVAVPKSVWTHALSVCYWRYHSEIIARQTDRKSARS